MNLNDLNNKRIMHIDMSRRFGQRGNSGIAFKIIETGEHKGMGLSDKLKKELNKNFKIKNDYAKLYAICIYYLIRDNLADFDVLIICNDEVFLYVKKYLDILFKDYEKYSEKIISCLAKLRKITGNKKLRSYADNIANTYRRKVFFGLVRQQKGIPLNIVKINYSKINKKLDEIITSV